MRKQERKREKRDGIEINIEKVERNLKRNKLDYMNKLENEKEIGEEEKKEKLRQREKISPGIEKLKRIFEIEKDRENQEPNREKSKVKEMRNVFEEMMRKGSEEKIEKRGNEKGARRKIFRRKDMSDNKKLNLKLDMRQSQTLENFFDGIPAENFKGRDLSKNTGENPSITEKIGIKMGKENEKSSGKEKNKFKTLKTIKVGKSKKNEVSNFIKSVNSEGFKVENGVFGTILRLGRGKPKKRLKDREKIM